MSAETFRESVERARRDRTACPCCAQEPCYWVVVQDLKAARKLAAAEPETVARLFHENYERLAPEHGYETREASAVPWESVPEDNRALMIATVRAVWDELAAQ